MPNPAELFIIFLIALVVIAAARLLTLGDAVGGALRSLRRRGPDGNEEQTD